MDPIEKELEDKLKDVGTWLPSSPSVEELLAVAMSTVAPETSLPAVVPAVAKSPSAASLKKKKRIADKDPEASGAEDAIMPDGVSPIFGFKSSFFNGHPVVDWGTEKEAPTIILPARLPSTSSSSSSQLFTDIGLALEPKEDWEHLKTLDEAALSHLVSQRAMSSFVATAHLADQYRRMAHLHQKALLDKEVSDTGLAAAAAMIKQEALKVSCLSDDLSLVKTRAEFLEKEVLRLQFCLKESELNYKNLREEITGDLRERKWYIDSLRAVYRNGAETAIRRMAEKDLSLKSVDPVISVDPMITKEVYKEYSDEDSDAYLYED